MATLWERTAHSVYRMSSLYLTFCNFSSHFGFEGGTSVLIESVPGQCLSFTFCIIKDDGKLINNSKIK